MEVSRQDGWKTTRHGLSNETEKTNVNWDEPWFSRPFDFGSGLFMSAVARVNVPA